MGAASQIEADACAQIAEIAYWGATKKDTAKVPGPWHIVAPPSAIICHSLHALGPCVQHFKEPQTAFSADKDHSGIRPLIASSRKCAWSTSTSTTTQLRQHTNTYCTAGTRGTQEVGMRDAVRGGAGAIEKKRCGPAARSEPQQHPRRAAELVSDAAAH